MIGSSNIRKWPIWCWLQNHPTFVPGHRVGAARPREVLWATSKWTLPIHCEAKPGRFETSIIHIPTSSRVRERARERSKQCGLSKCERTSETSKRTSEWPSTYVSNPGCSAPLCDTCTAPLRWSCSHRKFHWPKSRKKWEDRVKRLFLLLSHPIMTFWHLAHRSQGLLKRGGVKGGRKAGSYRGGELLKLVVVWVVRELVGWTEESLVKMRKGEKLRQRRKWLKSSSLTSLMEKWKKSLPLSLFIKYWVSGGASCRVYWSTSQSANDGNNHAEPKQHQKWQKN